MKELKKLFKNNRAWVAKKLKKDSKYFKKLSQSQKPKYLWIGCSDSRVPPNEIVGLEPGELFVHRNIGNLFLSTDTNCLSVLEYAVEFLKVKHIIVCGHYGYGAIKAAINAGRKKGILDHWLKSVRDIYACHKQKLQSIKNLEKRNNLLVEFNVKQQVLNICDMSIIQKTWKANRSLWVHGLIYDLKTGLLKDLDLCFSNAGFKF